MTMIAPEPTEREALEELLADACHQAKREIPKVGSPALPTPWDEAHEFIDSLLDEWRVHG